MRRLLAAPHPTQPLRRGASGLVALATLQARQAMLLTMQQEANTHQESPRSQLSAPKTCMDVWTICKETRLRRWWAGPDYCSRQRRQAMRRPWMRSSGAGPGQDTRRDSSCHQACTCFRLRLRPSCRRTCSSEALRLLAVRAAVAPATGTTVAPRASRMCTGSLLRWLRATQWASRREPGNSRSCRTGL